MPRLAKSLPSYCKPKHSGQAIVTINGQDIYLGPHGTRASRIEYHRVIAEYLANGRQLAAPAEQVLVLDGDLQVCYAPFDRVDGTAGRLEIGVSARAAQGHLTPSPDRRSNLLHARIPAKTVYAVPHKAPELGTIWIRLLIQADQWIASLFVCCIYMLFALPCARRRVRRNQRPHPAPKSAPAARPFSRRRFAPPFRAAVSRRGNAPPFCAAEKRRRKAPAVNSSACVSERSCTVKFARSSRTGHPPFRGMVK